MNKSEARRKMIAYLKKRNIAFFEHLHDGGSCIVMVFEDYTTCPNSILESSIYFWDTCMETRVYFSENASGWIKERSDDLADMYRLMNFINARIWPFSHDGIGGKLYAPHHLQTPRFYITEDGCYDLTATTVIDYDHYEMAPMETEDYCTATIPELMSKLSLPIFLLLTKEITVEKAITLIKREIGGIKNEIR